MIKPPRILYADGTEKEFYPANGTDFTLEEIYSVLKMEGNDYPCCQIVPLRSKGELMICEDNGIAYGLPQNVSATLYSAVDVIQHDAGVVGNVLICPPSMIE